MDASNYDGPLTAAELAASKARNGPSRKNIMWRDSGPAFAPTSPPSALETASYAQDRAEATDASAAYWSACACGSLQQPMAAEAATDEGGDPPKKAKRKRTLHWSLGVPLFCALLVVFLCAGWLLYLLPSWNTVLVLTLVIGAPMVFIASAALLLHRLI